MYCSLPIILFYLGFAVVRAYTVDDTNNTIQYLPVGFWIPYNTDFRGVDITRFYNTTVTWGICLTSDNCRIKIPFTGSGITVFNMVYGFINASFVIDEGSSQTYLHDALCGISGGCFNIPIINVQSLTYDNHVLEIALFSHTIEPSDFYLDYAVVNDTNPATLTATIPDSEPSSTGTIISPSHASPNKLRIVIGGALGGVVAIVLVALALLCIRKKHRSRTHAGHRKHATATFLVDPLPLSERVMSNGMSSTSLLTGFNTHKETIAPEALIAQDLTLPTAGPLPTVGDTVIPSQGLTVPQVASVQRLLRQDVPGPLVANVMEGMLSGQGSLSGGDATRGGAIVLPEMDVPPAYDFKQ